jgi:hypothetical protein
VDQIDGGSKKWADSEYILNSYFSDGHKVEKKRRNQEQFQSVFGQSNYVTDGTTY